MNLSPETLSAFIDGELPLEEMHRIEAALQDRPDLLAYVEQQHALRTELSDALSPAMNAPIPDRFLKAINETPTSWQWQISHAGGLFAPRNLAWTGVPAAAALACGLLIGINVGRDADIVNTNNGLVAHGQLAEALSNKLASNAGAGPSIGISFRAKDGRYCRTFATQSATAGIACRDASGWAIAALSAAPIEVGSQANYRPAASAMPDVIRNAVTGMIDGTPLDAAGERQVKAEDWLTH
ncbi:MAG TPA: hypothetical protein VK779_11765 [Rhizomicrobium sp.]|nr:hypothetical protein [Rhizomicrobium sp.]